MNTARRRGRAITVAALVAGAALAITGCSQGSGGDTKVTLRMLVNVTPALPVSFYQDLVKPFEKAHPNVTVKIEAPSSSTSNVQDTLTQQLAAGTEPDLVGGQTAPAEAKVMSTFPNEKWVSDTPLAKDLQIDGRQWTVGASLQAQSLVFYNEDAFTAAGITEAPKTVDDFTADLKKVKALGGYIPLGTAGQWVTAAQFQQLSNGIVMENTPNWYAKRTEGKVTFAGSDYEKYMDVYKSWIDDGLVPKDANGITYDDSITNFTSGKAATYVMGNWVVPTIDQAKPSFKVGVFAAPSFNGKTPPQVGGAGDLYSVLKSSKHQKESFELIQYLVSDKDAVTTQLKAEGNFRPGFTYDASPLTQAVSKLVDAAPGAVVAGDGFGSNVAPSGFSDQLSTTLQGLYLGDSVSKAISSLDQWWNTNAE